MASFVRAARCNDQLAGCASRRLPTKGSRVPGAVAVMLGRAAQVASQAASAGRASRQSRA